MYQKKVFSPNAKDKTPIKKIGFRDPYFMNIHEVTPDLFCEARIYDPEIKECGWQISRKSAHKKYRNWLHNIRCCEGCHMFRKVIYETRDISRNDDDVIVFKGSASNLAMTFRKPLSGANSYKSVASSKDHGVRADDNNYRPKMFTEKMGREISILRNNKKMTQSELANALNVETGVIKNIESGNLVAFNPDDGLVRSLARVLNIASIKYSD